MWQLTVVLFCLNCALILAHQREAFPGQNANEPLETHHQNHMHQQPSLAHPNSPPDGNRKFGGEQVQNVEHIKEHLDGKVDPTANMTPEQLQFHYFNMHDVNRDGVLDGIELIKAITHFHDDGSLGNQAPPPILSDAELERMIDPIFQSDDVNRDGFISYAEFSKAQKQREAEARAHHEQQQHQQQQQQRQQQHH